MSPFWHFCRLTLYSINESTLIKCLCNQMETHHFPIRERFNDILEEFPVYFIHFNPYEIDLDKKCLIEK